MELPSRFTQSWIERTLPSASPEYAQAAVEAMRRKGWTEEQLAERVFPHMPAGAAPVAAHDSASAVASPAELPADVTKQWLDTHLPSMSAEQIHSVMKELEDRGWSGTELTLGVMPHLGPKLSPDNTAEIVAGLRAGGMTDREISLFAPGLAISDPSPSPSSARAPQPSAREPTGPRIELPCPRGHLAVYESAEGFCRLRCPRCGTSFDVGMNLLCKGVEKRAVSESRVGWYRGYSVRTGTSYQVAYANPNPPPPQALLNFVEANRGSVHLRSGHRFTVIRDRETTFNKSPGIKYLINHEIGERWMLDRALLGTVKKRRR